MNLNLLSSNDPVVVEQYVRKKFKAFNSFTYSKKTRVSKCIQYYLAARGSMHGQHIIESVYQDVFKQLFPLEEAERVANAREHGAGKIKVESSEYLRGRENYRDEVEEALNKLKTWKQRQDYQTGESFFAELVTVVAFVDESICETVEFRSEFSAACKAKIESSVAITPEEVAAQFELMVGFEQAAACSFEARSENWGVINAKLEEAFKAGIWASGDAKAKMTKLGFSAELQAAIAIGAQLDLKGRLEWTKGRGQLALGGDAELFVGARAQAEMKLSVNARKGLEACIAAGAFAGFSATAKGYCSFAYDGRDVARVDATAAVTFGAGAEFEGRIKAPIFGPTEIGFAANLTLGLGVATSTTAKINFSEAALASSQEFRKVVYWRTLAKGYEMSLMNSDARNLYYLNKAIRRLTDELESTSETIVSFNKVPMEKRSLLM